MNKILILMAALGMNLASAKMIKETIYTGKLDQAALNSAFVVSKYYAVQIHQEAGGSFKYDLKTDLKNEDFNAGLYKATSFSLIPTISSKLAMSLRPEFKQVGEFKLTGEMISFGGELFLEKTKIGTVNYEFNMYSLKIRRIYNPKVTRDLENTKEGFIIFENREIP